jgi:hypothetical protein
MLRKPNGKDLVAHCRKNYITNKNQLKACGSSKILQKANFYDMYG